MNLDDILSNLTAELIWAVLVVILAFLFKRPLVKWLKRVKPAIDSKIPHLDFVSVYKPQAKYKSDITIKNSGGEPAYNVYVFLYVEFMDKSFSLQSLGSEGVRSGVLGQGEKLVFKDKDMLFDGCDVTCLNEVWVEFSNVAGANFRTVVHPPSPRGDDWRMEPPKYIKRKLTMMPGWHKTYDKKYRRKIVKGKIDLPDLYGKYRLKDRLRNWYFRVKFRLSNR